MRLNRTTRQANTKVTAMMTGVSLARIALISSEPMPGMRKICSVTMAPPKIAGHLQRDQRHHRDQRVAHHVLDDDDALAEPLGARRRDVVEADHVEHRGAHIARHRRRRGTARAPRSA